jgi:hypothetical protein
LASSWPPVIRNAFFAALSQIVGADWTHYGLLASAEPRHALLWVEGFADFQLRRRTDRAPIAAAERYFMLARNNQPFPWRDEAFTCAHRAVLSMADKISFVISRAMNPEAIHPPPFPETNDKEEWKAAYVQLAQTCRLLDDQRQAGEQWPACRERYQKQVHEVAWDHQSADALQTFLLLEANAAAPLVSHPEGEPPVALSAAETQTSNRVEGAGDRDIKERMALAELLLIGPNATKIAQKIGVKRTTLLGWQTFRENYDRAKQNSEVAKQSRRRGRRAGDRVFDTDVN